MKQVTWNLIEKRSNKKFHLYLWLRKKNILEFPRALQTDRFFKKVNLVLIHIICSFFSCYNMNGYVVKLSESKENTFTHHWVPSQDVIKAKLSIFGASPSVRSSR